MKYILVGIKDIKLIANAFVESQNNKISPTKIGYFLFSRKDNSFIRYFKIFSPTKNMIYAK